VYGVLTGNSLSFLDVKTGEMRIKSEQGMTKFKSVVVDGEKILVGTSSTGVLRYILT